MIPPSHTLDPVTEAVKRDLDERAARGLAKYGVALGHAPLPLRQVLQHAYEECLDQAQYLKRAIMEIDATSPPPATK